MILLGLLLLQMLKMADLLLHGLVYVRHRILMSRSYMFFVTLAGLHLLHGGLVLHTEFLVVNLLVLLLQQNWGYCMHRGRWEHRFRFVTVCKGFAVAGSALGTACWTPLKCTKRGEGAGPTCARILRTVRHS